MKRLYIAAALLIALLGASLANAWYAQRLTGEMREELSQAQLHAKQGNWSRADTLEERQKRDMYKNNFCFENDIPIIRIPYTHLNKLHIQDLLPETSPFLLQKPDEE